MSSCLRSILAETIKLRRQPLPLIHLLVPSAGAGIFLAFYAFTPYSPVSKALAYMQVLAAAYPVMIGIVCAIAADQEAAAGQYQQLLTQPSRLVPLAGKLTLLLGLGFGSSVLASVGFGSGFLYWLRQSPFELGFYLKAACILFASTVILYALHLYVGLRFGRGASIGLGVMESLLAALLLTGLGDRIWIYVPSAWAPRFITLWMQAGISEHPLPAELLFKQGILLSIAGTLLSMLLLGWWFCRWEGRLSHE